MTVTVPKSTYTVLIDNTVSLQCSVTGLPSATEVYWEKRGINNNFIRVDPTSNNRYSGGNLNNPTLAISSSKFEDEGVYRCVGVNAAGRAESIETTLDVTGSKFKEKVLLSVLQHISLSYKYLNCIDTVSLDDTCKDIASW